MGHQHPQIDVNWRHRAALQLVFSELDRVYIVKLEDQTTKGAAGHLRGQVGTGTLLTVTSTLPPASSADFLSALRDDVIFDTFKIKASRVVTHLGILGLQYYKPAFCTRLMFLFRNFKHTL